MGNRWSNWSGSVRFEPGEIQYPANEQELAALVKAASAKGRKVRVAGAGHSFTRLVETPDILVSLDKLSGLISVDKENLQAEVWAGTRLFNLGPLLYEKGLGLINQGDIDVQSVAGAFSTGTHGTGIEFGTLSTCIVGLSIMTASGELLRIDENSNAEWLNAARVALGSLGIITRMKLQLVPAYKLKYEGKKGKLNDVLQNLEDYKQRNRNFEFYWFPYTETVQIKETNQTQEEPKKSGFGKWLNDIVLENGVFWIISKKARVLPFLAKTAAKLSAWGVSGSSNTNWSHLVYATPRLVRFQEMEYNLPEEHFETALREIDEMIRRKNVKVHFPLECRWVAPDDIWLSPAYQRKSAYIAAHMYKGMQYQAYFEAVEEICNQYQGRPHWGKMHFQTPEKLAQLYPKWNEFHALRRELDPKGLFMSPYLEKIFGKD